MVCSVMPAKFFVEFPFLGSVPANHQFGSHAAPLEWKLVR